MNSFRTVSPNATKMPASGRLAQSPELSIGRREVHIWIANLDLRPADLEFLRSTLSRDERSRAEGIWVPTARRNYVAARGLLRTLLSWYTQIPAADQAFQASGNGKPHLAGGGPGARLEFNLSHAGDFGAFAFTLGRTIGIDIEQARNGIPFEALSRRVLSESEQREFNQLRAADRLGGFLTSWTHKEAYLKATGVGLARPLSSVEVPGFSRSPSRAFFDPVEGANSAPWWLESFTPAPGYVGSLAVQGERPNVRYRRWPA